MRICLVKTKRTKLIEILTIIYYYYYYYCYLCQDSFIMRDFEGAEVYFGDDGEEIVADAGNNADLYAANQGSTDLIINEVYTEEAPLCFKLQESRWYWYPPATA